MENTTKGFVLGNDKDDDTEVMVKKDIHALHVDRLSHRVTLITILIPILIGIIGYFIYDDIQKKVTQVHDTGTTEFKTLSEDLASKFSSLSVQLSKFEEETTKTVKNLEASVSAFKNDVASLSQKYASVDKEMDQANASQAKLSKKLDSASKELVALKEIFGNVEKKWDGEREGLQSDISATQKTIDTLNTKVDKVAASKLDRDAFVAELNKLNETLGNLNRKVTDKLSTLEAKMEKLSSTRSATPAVTPPSRGTSQPPAGNVRMTRNPPGSDAPPSSSGLQEQDIQE